MKGLLVAKGRFVTEKKRDLKLGFFERPEYPFLDGGRYFEIEPIIKEYDDDNLYLRANDFVKENASKYCDCLGISSSRLIELIENEEIFFSLHVFVEKWVIVYYNEHSDKCTEIIDMCKINNSVDPELVWSKFKYLYCTHGGNSNVCRKFRPIETMKYSVWQGRGVSIKGRSLLDEMMDKAVQHAANALNNMR